MNEILKILKSGAQREKLGVVADLFGIAGISIAAIVGGLLAIGKGVKTINLIVAIAYSLCCFGGLVIALAISLIFINFIKERFKLNPRLQQLFIIATWAFLIAALLIASIFYYEVISSFQIY